MLHHTETSFLLDANKVLLCKGRKTCWLCLKLCPFHVFESLCMCRHFSGGAGCVGDTEHTLSELWKASLKLTVRNLKILPCATATRGSPTWWKECECPWSAWEVWFLSWKLGCWVCYWMFHICVVPSSSGFQGWDLICSLKVCSSYIWKKIWRCQIR